MNKEHMKTKGYCVNNCLEVPKSVKGFLKENFLDSECNVSRKWGMCKGIEVK